MPRLLRALLLIGLAGVWSPAPAQAAPEVDERWSDPAAVERRLDDLADDSRRAEVDEIGHSPGDRPLMMLTIEPVAGNDDGRPGPAILVVGDPQGTTPLATEAVLFLAESILSADDDDPAGAVRWYLLPMLDPDGAARFFARPLRQDGRNLTPVDDDRDGAFAEDGPDDLNGDGLVGQMYLADPDGDWVLDGEPPLPRAFNPARDAGPRYLCLPEGRDDDQDGRWNEDGPGGVVPGANFPHRYEHWTTGGGRWPGDQPESRAMLDFAFARRDIAMVLVLGASNLWRLDPEDLADKDPSQQRHRFPETRARRIGVDPGQEFSLSEVVELLQQAMPERIWDERRTLRYLGEDAATKLHAEDLTWWREIRRSYQAWLDSTGAADVRLESPPLSGGSLTEWAYFQYGVPAFAVDFWSLPLAEPDTTGVDSLAVGSAVEADEEPTATAAWQSLAAYTDQLAGDEADAWPGLRPWDEVDLPQGRRALTGGAAPFCFTTPPASLVDSLLQQQVPFLLTLPGWLPELAIASTRLTPLAADAYELEVEVANPGRLPYPTAHGARTGRLPPVVITVSGGEVIEGRARQTVAELRAHGSRKVRWILRADVGQELVIEAAAPSLGAVEARITCDRQGGRR